MGEQRTFSWDMHLFTVVLKRCVGLILSGVAYFQGVVMGFHVNPFVRKEEKNLLVDEKLTSTEVCCFLYG